MLGCLLYIIILYDSFLCFKVKYIHLLFSLLIFNNFSKSKMFIGSLKAYGESISLVRAFLFVLFDAHLKLLNEKLNNWLSIKSKPKEESLTYKLITTNFSEEKRWKWWHLKFYIKWHLCISQRNKTKDIWSILIHPIFHSYIASFIKLFTDWQY